MKTMKFRGFETLYIHVLEDKKSFTMLPDVNQTPELTIRSDGQPSSGITPAPVQSQNSAGVFRVGLTRAEAYSDTKLKPLFNQYNKDNDDTISQAEFDTYTAETTNPQQQEVVGRSGKRTAVGGIYTVKPNDSINLIAKDFGVTVLDLYNANKEVIGKSANSMIHPGQRFVIPRGNQPQEVTAPRKRTFQQFVENGVNITREEYDAIFDGLTPEQRREVMHEFRHEVESKSLDMGKIDSSLASVANIDELASRLGVNMEAWNAADHYKQANLLVEALGTTYRKDLDENNENSQYSQELNRLRTSGPTDRERELYGNSIDFNNLSDDNLKSLAKFAVQQKYAASLFHFAHENENNITYSLATEVFMKSNPRADMGARGNNLCNAWLASSNLRLGEADVELLRNISNTHLATYKKTGEEDETMEKVGLSLAMSQANKESIEQLYQNNGNYLDVLNEVAQNVANNTTDESRRAMLNNIIENSAVIAQGGAESGSGAGGGGRGGSLSGGGAGNPAGAQSILVSNPIIQNVAQVNYVNDLRNASSAFQATNNASSAIQQHYHNSFSTIQGYLDFKGTGMTMSEYQRTKAALKNHVISVVNELVENYSTIPDKFKPKVLAMFDAMDNNTCGELYFNGSPALRTFMDKYNYMSDEKLLAFAQLHPESINMAPDNVKEHIEELQQHR